MGWKGRSSQRSGHDREGDPTHSSHRAKVSELPTCHGPASLGLTGVPIILRQVGMEASARTGQARAVLKGAEDSAEEQVWHILTIVATAAVGDFLLGMLVGGILSFSSEPSQVAEPSVIPFPQRGGQLLMGAFQLQSWPKVGRRRAALHALQFLPRSPNSEGYACYVTLGSHRPPTPKPFHPGGVRLEMVEDYEHLAPDSDFKIDPARSCRIAKMREAIRRVEELK
jgi:hypothetical protein